MRRWLLAVLTCLACQGSAPGGGRLFGLGIRTPAIGNAAWTPTRSPLARRGGEISERFGLERRWLLSVQVNDAASPVNRVAIARAERELAELPGVRAVLGPSSLLAFGVGGGGLVVAEALLPALAHPDSAAGLGGGPPQSAVPAPTPVTGSSDAGTADTGTSTASTAAAAAADTDTDTDTDTDAPDEATRRRLERRPDAAGWFMSRDGTEVRLLVEMDDPSTARSHLAGVEQALERILLDSGVVLLGGPPRAEPLLPVPDRGSVPPSPLVPLLVVAAFLTIFAVPALYRAKPGWPRAALAASGGGLGASALGMFAPVEPVRRYAWCAGGLVVLAVLLIEILVRGRVAKLSRAVATPSRLGPPAGVGIRLGAPWLVVVCCAGLLVFQLDRRAELRLETHLWHSAQLAFIDLRGDFGEPIVLRELRRLADFVRGEPDVAEAWSIADTVGSLSRASGRLAAGLHAGSQAGWPDEGAGVGGGISLDERGGIPEDRRTVDQLLARASNDGAARLLVTADRQEALLVVRLDPAADRERLAHRLAMYVARGLRHTLARVDLDDDDAPVAARGFARGVAAGDGALRVRRLCGRAGRNLDETDADEITRWLRQATLAPNVDLPRLQAELRQQVLELVERVAFAERRVALPRASATLRLADELAREPWHSTTADVTRLVVHSGLGRELERALAERAPELAADLAAIRRRNAGRLDVRALLSDLDLPVEGRLSEEIRDTVFEAMGPVVGVEVAAAPEAEASAGPSGPFEARARGLGPGPSPVFRLDGLVVGGIAQDAALSEAWVGRVWVGLGVVALWLAGTLMAIGGPRALGWFPVALAPCALALAAPTLGAVAAGIWWLAVASGALAGGVVFAVVFAPTWRRS
jgi:hypothetical protein